MRRSRGGQPDGDINIANSAGKMLQGLGWREWCGGEGQARRRRVAGIMVGAFSFFLFWLAANKTFFGIRYDLRPTSTRKSKRTDSTGM